MRRSGANASCSMRCTMVASMSRAMRTEKLTRTQRRPSSVRNELERDREARFGCLAVLVLRDREPPARHLARDAVVDLAREALRRAVHRAAGLVDRQRQRDLTARARVLLEVLLVAALETSHVRALDLRQHDVGRQARLVERLLVGDLDATGR